MRVLILRGLMIATLALTVSNGVAFAGPLEDAQAAFERGDYATALKLMKPLAAQGNAVAQTRLGIMYENGQGVPQDYDKAVKWYRLAATQGYATAQSNLGGMYLNGQPVRRTTTKRLSGSGLRPNKGTPAHRPNSDYCTNTFRTPAKQPSGSGSRLNKER